MSDNKTNPVNSENLNNKKNISTPENSGVEINSNKAKIVGESKDKVVKSASVAPPVKSDYPSGAPKFDKKYKEKNFGFVSYIVSFGIAFLFAFLIANFSGAFDKASNRKLFGILSDAFFVPGVLFLAFAILFKVAEGGLFDGVSFVLGRAFLSLIPGGRIKKEDNYATYKQKKEEKRKRGKYTSMFVVGAVFCLLSILFLILYSNF